MDANVVECGGERVNLQGGVADSGGIVHGKAAEAAADHEIAGGRRRECVIHKTIRKFVAESAAKLRGEGD